MLNLLTATVQKIVTEILPPQNGVSFAKEARDLLIECCVEFITLISSEANEISEKEAKKTIACDHITKALEQLGFTDYVPAVMEAAQEHKEVQKVRVTAFLFHSGKTGNHRALTLNTGTREEVGQVCQQWHVDGGAGTAAGGAVCSSEIAPCLERLAKTVRDFLWEGSPRIGVGIGIVRRSTGMVSKDEEQRIGNSCWGLDSLPLYSCLIC